MTMRMTSQPAQVAAVSLEPCHWSLVAGSGSQQAPAAPRRWDAIRRRNDLARHPRQATLGSRHAYPELAGGVITTSTRRRDIRCPSTYPVLKSTPRAGALAKGFSVFLHRLEMTMTTNVGRVWPIIGITMVLLVSGCASDTSIHPAAAGPVVDGHPTCAYVVSKDECEDSGVPPRFWYQMPADQPLNYTDANTDLASQLFLWRLIYQPTWYAQPVYRDTYVPATYRDTYDRIYIQPFSKRYASLSLSRQNRARFVDRSNKPVPANQVNDRRVNGCALYAIPALRGGGGGTGGSGGNGGKTGGAGGIKPRTGGKPAPYRPHQHSSC